MTDADAVRLFKKWRARRIANVREYMKTARSVRIPRNIVREDLATWRAEIAAYGRAIRSLEGKAKP